LAGHFPGHPVMPGVLVIEAMAQAGGVLLMHDVPDRKNKLIYFTTINKAKFRRPVVPGDQVRLEIEILRLRETFCKLSARALVDGQLVAEAVLSSAMMDR
jgi:3-hydroxymyristoyl/3-hydroxydecanoyl-(acyl carrier protein) dehydratase